jgi:hypothetical protein
MFEDLFLTQLLRPNSLLQKTNGNVVMQSLTKVKNEKSEKVIGMQEMTSRNNLVGKLEKSQFIEIENKYNFRP